MLNFQFNKKQDPKVLEDVKDRSELTQARLQSINKQYTELRAKEKDLNAKIADIYKGSQ